MKKFLAILNISVLFTVLGTQNIFADEWSVVSSTDSRDAVNIVAAGEWDIPQGGNLGSLLQYNRPTSDGYVPKVCTKYGDDICSVSRLKNLQAAFVFPNCSASVSSWCISDAVISLSEKPAVKAKFIRYVEGNTYPGDSSIKLPTGGTISLWKIEDERIPSDLYFAVKISGWANWTTGVPFFHQTSGNVYAVRLLKDPSYQPNKYLVSDNGIPIQQFGTKCKNPIFVEDGLCASSVFFPENVSVELSVNLPNHVGGFFTSRMNSPELSVSTAFEGIKVIRIKGSPLMVPRFGIPLTRDDARYLSPGLSDKFNLQWSITENREDGWGLKIFDQLRVLGHDKASGYSSVWNFSTLSSSEDNSQSAVNYRMASTSNYALKCKIPQSELLGYMSTNAMIYDPTAPAFENDEIVYTVASMHFQPDGVTPQLGYYSLLVSRKLASCLYKNDGIPIRAAVSITHPNDSSTVISTESVRVIGDYFALDISGFNYSTPSIGIKYEYESKTNALPLKAPEPKKSIICIKGKLVKKVVSKAPKCPSGYRKK